jgi:hypothetical protein
VSSTATHKPGDGQEIAFNAVVPSIVPGVQAALAGATLANRLPWLSTAKQSAAVAQLTAVSWCPASIVSGPDQPPLAGVLEKATLPVLSTAMQSETDGQLTASMWFEASAGRVPVHVSGGAACAAIAVSAPTQSVVASARAVRRPSRLMVILSIVVLLRRLTPQPRRNNPRGLRSERWIRQPPVRG